MIGQSAGHRRSTWLAPLFLFGEFLMDDTKIVRAANQVHPRVQSLQTGSGVPTFARQAGQPLSEGSIQPLDKSSIEDASPARELKQLFRLIQYPMSHPPCDLNHPFFLRSLDHCANVEVWPNLQARSSHSHRAFDLLSKRSADAPRIRAPAVCQHEEGTQASRALANLSHQAISQATIPRELDHSAQPQARRNHHGQCHPANHLASFDPNFIGLHVHQVQLPLLNDGLMHLLALRSRSITPIGHGPFIQAESLDNGLKRASIGQERHDYYDQLHRLASAFEHRSI
jgi:hypothetical protein